MKRRAQQFVLALPAAFLLLSADRIRPDRFPPPVTTGVPWAAAAPSLPGVDEGRFGRPEDPLAVVLVATPSSLRAALSEAGWTEVPTSARGALAAGLLPMADHRLIGRRQNMNWARFEAGGARMRLWFTGLVDPLGRAYWWGGGAGARDAAVATLSRSRYLESATLVALPQLPSDVADGRAALIVLSRGPEPARAARP